MEWVWTDPHVLAVRAMEVLSLASLIPIVAKEWKGETLPYSKFAPSSSPSAAAAITEEKKFDDSRHDSSLTRPATTTAATMIPSRPAMLIIYSPALFLCSCFLLLQLLNLYQHIPAVARLTHPIPHSLSHFFFLQRQYSDSRPLVFASAVTLHFLKRDLEVLFVHKYSGAIETKMCLMISFAYFYSCATAFYALQVSINSNTPYSMSLLGYGVAMFILGIGGNFYHHYLLACLRPKNPTSSKSVNHQYVTPKGGLFSLVVCPHYLFEFIDFLGLAMISQTKLSFISALAVLISLAMRSRSTKLWYLKKIEDFPRNRKCFLPYVF